MRIPFRKSPNPSFGVDARDDGFDDNDAAAALRGSLVGRLLLRRMIARKEAAKRHVMNTCAAALRSTTCDVRTAAHRRGCAPVITIETIIAENPMGGGSRHVDGILLTRAGRVIGHLEIGEEHGGVDSDRRVYITADPTPDMMGRRRTARLATYDVLRYERDATGNRAPTLDDVERWAGLIEAITDLVGDDEAQALSARIKATHEARSARIRIEAGLCGAEHAVITSAAPDGRPARIEIPDRANQRERVLDMPVADTRPAVVVSIVSGSPVRLSVCLQHTTVEAITDPIEVMRALSMDESVEGAERPR